MKKFTINQAIKELKISRSTLYRCLKDCDIETVKQGRKSYLTHNQVLDIEEKIKLSQSQKHNETVETDKNIESLKKSLQVMQEKNEQLLLQLGESKGRAKTLEEQNNKLFFKLGTISEKVAQLENDKSRLIEISETKKNTNAQNFFKKISSFFIKNP